MAVAADTSIPVNCLGSERETYKDLALKVDSLYNEFT
jgi:hypothetical protein